MLLYRTNPQPGIQKRRVAAALPATSNRDNGVAVKLLSGTSDAGGGFHRRRAEGLMREQVD
ncbi:MAG TPA: hypothetical protein VG206_11375 [Terriglobia bacterium]|nr:hypothetical protein [Terriglobia bacterium]